MGEGSGMNRNRLTAGKSAASAGTPSRRLREGETKSVQRSSAAAKNAVRRPAAKAGGKTGGASAVSAGGRQTAKPVGNTAAGGSQKQSLRRAAGSSGERRARLPEKKLPAAKEPAAPKKAEKANRFSSLRSGGRVLRQELKNITLNFNKDAVRPDDILRVKGGFDRPMFLIILILVCFGSVMVFSSSYAYALFRYDDSYYFIRRQLMFVALGIVIMLAVTAFVDYRWIRRLSRIYFPLVVVLLVAVLVAGLSEGEAKRWLNLGIVTIQPSEFMKLSLVLTLADYYMLVDKQVKDRRFWVSSAFGTFLPAILVALVCMLIALEKHVSGTIIMFLIGILIIFCGGGKVLWIAGVGGAFAAAVALIIGATGYASKRLDIWLHPELYSAQNEVWQTLQGLYAVGSGGMLGVGLGEGRQKHLFISQPQNDFIFAVICEELGFVGAVAVIALFAAFIWRGFKIAMKAPDVFSRLTVIGIVGKVGIQALLNIAVVTASIPNTGVTLPFFSYGGSSLTSLLAEMGIVLAISRYSTEQK